MTPADSLNEARRTAGRALARFSALLRSGIDPDRAATPDWSVGDVAAHVAGFLPVYLDIVEGGGSPVASLDAVPAFNAETVARLTERDLGRLADRIDHDGAAVLAAAGTDDVEVAWHGGAVVPRSAVLGAVAGEGYLHGLDVARASGRPWELPADDAATVFAALVPMLPHLVDPAAAAGLHAAYEVRLRRVPGGRWLFLVDDGALRVIPADGRRADWTVSATPAANLLTAYGRLSPLRAALTGQVAAWGRHPGLGRRLTTLFVTV